MTIQERLQALRAKQEELTRELRELSTELFADATAALFAAQPTLASFQWTQYTPYFNDGSACEFEVNRDHFTITDKAGTEYSIDPWAIMHYAEKGTDWRGDPYIPSDAERVGLEVGKFLNQFESTELYTMFGDHVSVTVRRDGTIEVDAYDHD